MLEPSKSAKPKSRRRLTLAAIPVAGLLFLGSTVTSQAFTPDVIEQVDHFVECFGWMITDPEMHQSKCGSARNPLPNESLGSGGGNGSGVVAPATPPDNSNPPDNNEGGNNEGGGIV